MRDTERTGPGGRDGRGFEAIEKAARALSRPYRVSEGGAFRLKKIDPRDTGGLKDEDRPRAAEALRDGTRALASLQEKLWADNRWAVLLVFQAMDAAGKDGAIKHVMSGVNPQGCQVASFKAPSSEELDHDFLWRCHERLPERGRIGIFNRSYYEEVLVVRVHPDLLGQQRIPPALIGDRIWDERCEDIRAFERYLTRNGTVIRKFFLHVSREEQRRRFLERIETPSKNWKFSPADLKERSQWNKYMSAYEDVIRKTATPFAPWYIVPADHKWFTRAVVASAVVDALASLRLRFPSVGAGQRAILRSARSALRAEP